ncbi:hypothetical protein ERO13_D05G239100v2 [Gossypium hirsutum]|uniref:Protein HAPLESS 2-like n=1 Tax=Gossypium hirsutum TaxID=3635 RepID=A0A1U8MVD5_GOSHI|nr:uncharacterized protein LOC107940557 [Gossypium hirsutum]KAG4147703.1 hypothetical protein ERO13_D05G239100v2 [Gossypium hirsutum]
MENVVSSVFSGFIQAIGKLFRSPLDFLAGKSCSSICGSTWDLICYIENFCVANILKLIMVLVLSYIVLLYLYLLYKVGICQCIAHGLCRMVWGCISCWFSSWEFCCTFLCHKLRNIKRIDRRRRRPRQRKRVTDTSEDDESFSYGSSRPMEVSNHSVSSRLRNYKGVHLRKSLRPRNHRINVGISRDALYKRKPIKHINTVHDIRVTHTSRFAHKGSSYKGRPHHSRRSIL